MVQALPLDLDTPISPHTAKVFCQIVTLALDISRADPNRELDACVRSARHANGSQRTLSYVEHANLLKLISYLETSF